MTTTPSAWNEFHRTALLRPPRELLVRTLNFFAVERRPPGIAVDLGCGSGPDAAELLKRGWQVHAVDADASGLDMLRQHLPAEVQDRLHTHALAFADFRFPACDLVWAGFSLPFCAAADWPALRDRAVAALRPGGRFAGDLFGENHAWSVEPDVHTLSEAQARAALSGLTLEAFDIEHGLRVSGGEITRWHAFGFAARRGVAADGAA